MPGRIRLLTFTQLPGLRTLSAESPLATAIDAITATSVVFENHYLQRQGPESILNFGLPGDAERHSGRETRQEFRQTTKKAKACLVLPSTNSEFDSVNLPDWLNATTLGLDSTKPPALPQNQVLAALSDADFAWLHVDTAVNATSLDIFNGAIDAIRSLSTAANDTIITTALHGHQTPDDLPFESLLWEGSIRVPLWLLHSELPHRRIQCCTCGDDVGNTIRLVLNVEAATQPAVASSSQTAANLLKLADTPGEVIERAIRIETASVKALRTNNFLFAMTSETDGAESALYAKPEDVWNVNDVSAEFLEITERFETQLRQLSAGEL